MSAETPLVSVIVPVYNVETYLDACLESLAKQTLADIEIICIDDGSTDGSAAILDRWHEADARIRVEHRANSGVACSRNVALDMARGEYILFVDSDDYIAYRSCEVLVDIARKESADIVVFGGKTFPTSFWADASFSEQDQVFRDDSVHALLNERGSNPLMCNKLYRRALIEENHIRFNEKLILGEDNAFQFMVFPRAKCIAFTSDKLYFYRIRRDSAVFSRKDEHAKKLLMHFDVVKFVWEQWQAAGFAAGNEARLVGWAATFLYNEAAHVSFNERRAFAQDFQVALHNLIGDTPVESFDIDQYKIEQAQFLLAPLTATEGTPLVTVFLESLDGNPAIKETLETVLNQLEQRVEIIVLPSTAQAWVDAMHAAAELDSRISFAATKNPAELVEMAKGQYATLLSSSVSLEISAFKRLMDVINFEETTDGSRPHVPRVVTPDGVLYGDSAHRLRTHDQYAIYDPNPAINEKAKTLFSASELDGGLFGITSLFTCNKLLSLELLKQGLAHKPADMAQAVLMAVTEGKHLAVTTRPVVTLYGLFFDDLVRATALAGHMKNHVQAMVDLAQNQSGPLAVHDIKREAPLFYLSMVELVSQQECAQAMAAEWKDASWWKDALSQPSYFIDEDDRALIESFVALPSQQFFEQHLHDKLDRLIKVNETTLITVGDQAGIIASLSTDIKEFYRSISYRVGRLVTLAPRKMRNLLRKNHDR